MKGKAKHDLIKAFHRLTDAAEEYVNRSPRVKRIQEQRSALLDAIAHAQLLLSVQQLPKESVSEQSSSKDKRAPLLEKELKRIQNTFKDFDRSLRPVSTELEALQERAAKARALLESVLAKHSQDAGNDASMQK